MRLGGSLFSPCSTIFAFVLANHKYLHLRVTTLEFVERADASVKHSASSDGYRFCHPMASEFEILDDL